MPPPASVIRCCSACMRSRAALASRCPAITRSTSSVSAGIRASTSAGEKYRSANERHVHEDRVHLLRSVHAAGQSELDVSRAAGPRDEVNGAAPPHRRLAFMPRFQNDAELLERLDQRGAIEDRDVVERQERGGT